MPSGVKLDPRAGTIGNRSAKRNERSSDLGKRRSKAASIRLSETLDSTPAELVRIVKEFGVEGILAKRADSLYESGKRSGAWLKYRINKGQELSSAATFRIIPSTRSSSAIMTAENCSMRARCETGSSRTPARRSQANSPA
jgi:hypothetical protein